MTLMKLERLEHLIDKLGRTSNQVRQDKEQLTKVLQRIVFDFETNYVVDGVVVDDPPDTYKTAWELARAAISITDTAKSAAPNKESTP